MYSCIVFLRLLLQQGELRLISQTVTIAGRDPAEVANGIRLKWNLIFTVVDAVSEGCLPPRLHDAHAECVGSARCVFCGCVWVCVSVCVCVCVDCVCVCVA